MGTYRDRWESLRKKSMFVSDICEENTRLLKDTDFILASYPRSGNTWMRLLLSDIILQSQGFKTQLGGNFIPDIYKEKLDIWSRDPRVKKVPLRIVKSHQFYDKRYINTIYLFRKPADALCSFYYYSLGYPEQREGLQKQGIDDFCKVKVEQWRTHVESYIEAKNKKSDKVLFISYESLKENPEILLRKTTRDFLGLNITSRMCKIAVENQNFEGLQRIQKLEDTSKLGFWEAGGYQDFFRKGKVNSSKYELAQSTIDFIEANAMAIYNLALSIEKLDFQKESNQGMAMIKDKIEDLVSLGKQSSLALKLNGLLSHRNEVAVSQVQIDHQLEQYKLQLQQVQEHLQELQAENKQVKTELEQSQSQLHQTQAELEQSQSQLHQTQEVLEQSQSQLHQTQEVLEQFQDQVQQAETLLQEYQGQLHQTQADLEQSQSQLHQTQADLQECKEELGEFQAIAEQSQEQLHQTHAVLEQSQSKLHETQAELAQTKSQLYQSQWEEERSRFQLHQTQAELHQTQAELANSQSELRQIKAQVEHFQSQVDETQTLFRESQLQVQQLHKNKNELKRVSHQFYHLQKELENSESQLHQTNAQLEQLKSQFSHTQLELEQSQSQLHQTNARLEQLKSQFSHTQLELEQSESQLHQTNAQLEQLKSQFSQTQLELVRTRLKNQYVTTEPQSTNETEYKLLVWDAWYAYQSGDLKKMQQCLQESLKFTPISRTESIVNWLECFAKFASEKGYYFDSYALTNLPEWKRLIQQRVTVSKP